MANKISTKLINNEFIYIITLSIQPIKKITIKLSFLFVEMNVFKITLIHTYKTT